MLVVVPGPQQKVQPQAGEVPAGPRPSLPCLPCIAVYTPWLTWGRRGLQAHPAHPGASHRAWPAMGVTKRFPTRCTDECLSFTSFCWSETNWAFLLGPVDIYCRTPSLWPGFPTTYFDLVFTIKLALHTSPATGWAVYLRFVTQKHVRSGY